MGKWAKRLRGERESGRNDPGAKRLGAKGKVGERLGGERESGRNDPDSDHTCFSALTFARSQGSLNTRPQGRVFGRLLRDPANVNAMETRRPLVLYHSPECGGYAELEQTWKYKSTQCSISSHPYRNIRNKFDPVIKMVKVNQGSSFEKKAPGHAHTTTWYKFWQHFKAFIIPIILNQFQRPLLPHYFVLFHTCTRVIQ